MGKKFHLGVTQELTETVEDHASNRKQSGPLKGTLLARPVPTGGKGLGGVFSRSPGLRPFRFCALSSFVP